MHRPAIVVGTVDSLVSKALNRGYGIGRATYPIDFALVTNGAHWVIDEIQLCPESTTTLRQLAAFAAAFGTAEPFGLTCMSATVPETLLDTVDNPAPGPAGRAADRASRADRRTGAAPGRAADRAPARGRAGRLPGRSPQRRARQPPARNAHARRAEHGQGRPGRCTRSCAAGRCRARCCTPGSAGIERQQLVEKMTAPPGEQGHIVVATQVVEAGIDLNAAVLVTEAAPWPCVVQRAGRCNRTGRIDDALLYWVRPATHHPYPEPDVERRRAELQALRGPGRHRRGSAGAGRSPTPTQRWPCCAGPTWSGCSTPRRTSAAPTWTSRPTCATPTTWTCSSPGRPGSPRDGERRRPPAEAKAPAAEWRCRVPLRELDALHEAGRRGMAAGPGARPLDQSDARTSAPGPARYCWWLRHDGGYDPRDRLRPGGAGHRYRTARRCAGRRSRRPAPRTRSAPTRRAWRSVAGSRCSSTVTRRASRRAPC